MFGAYIDTRGERLTIIRAQLAYISC